MTLQALSRETHKGLRLRTPPGMWSFARERMIAGLVATELIDAIKTMPLAFTLHEQQTNLVALMGLGGQNLFIGPRGEWLGQYIPAALRAWPFGLMQQGERRVVALDVDCEAVSAEEGDVLFAENGEPSERLQKTVKFLQSFSDQETVMSRALDGIRKAGLLVPWELTVTRGDGTPVNIGGLHQVDKQAFESLGGEAFLELRTAGALPVIYAHVFSQRNIAVLEELARRQSASAPADVESHLPQTLYITDDYLKF